MADGDEVRRDVATKNGGVIAIEYERNARLDTYTITFSGELLRTVDSEIFGRALRDFALVDVTKAAE